ncbi:MAG: membrane protein insertion efficiency factor YidD [Elusimicrobia bacterium]|nr:membrane protein insertion efficiency factor YidD [Elusimicrobiota bacterium]
MQKKFTDSKLKSLPSSLMLKLVRFYQKFISPLTLPRCRFHPSCSEYFAQSLIEKGLIKGSSAGVYRILRCHPFSNGGYDPVKKGTK